MAAVVEAIPAVVTAAVAGFPFCAGSGGGGGTELAYAAPAPDIELRSALELNDGDDDNIVG